MKIVKLYGPFLWMGFKFLKATESLWGDSLLFTTQSPGIPGTRLINLSGMKGWNNLDLEGTFQIWIQDPGLVIKHLNH